MAYDEQSRYGPDNEIPKCIKRFIWTLFFLAAAVVIMICR